MSDLSPGLARFGDVLERAVAAEITTQAASRRRRRTRRGWLWLFAAAVLLTGGAAATDRYFDEATVARSLPAGTQALMGVDSTCTEIRPGVEFDCVLDAPPRPEIPDWTGTVEPSLGAGNEVIGGCRALNAAGTRWRCYVGREAVVQRIIAPGMLGTRSPGPGNG